MPSQSAELDRWARVGPSRIAASGGPATGVLFHVAIRASQPQTIYVSSPTCGVWVSTVRGGSWRDASGNLPSFAVVGLAVDGDGHVYAALADAGVYRSIDGGGSWSLMGNPPSRFPAITDLLADPVSPAVLHVATNGGIYRSADGGASWQLSRPGMATCLVMAPGDPNTLYAGIPGVGVARTQNARTSGPTGWTTLTPGLGGGVIDVRVALSAADPSTVYARLRIGNNHNVYATNDAGVNWELRSTLNVYTALIAADNTDAARVYVAGVDFYRSDDGGKTWTIKPGVHVDHHAVAADPGEPGAIYTACDGGLYRSIRGDRWGFLGDGLLNVEFYDLAVSATRPELAIGGTQDNGTALTDGSSTAWKKISGGDGGTVAIDPHDANVMYAMQQYATSMAQSTDGGQSFRNIGTGLPSGAACLNLHFQTHPVAPGVLLACCGSLWRTTMPAVAWSAIFTAPGAPSESVSRCAVGRDDWYYAATNTGRIYMAKGGTGWELGFVHPAAAAIVDLVVDDDDPAVLFAAFSSATQRVYRFRRSLPPTTATSAGSQPAMAAPDLSVGLLRRLDGALGPLSAADLGGPPTAASLRTLAIDAMRPDTVYVGTSRGVFRVRSTDRAATWRWSDYSAGIARADVRALRVQPSTGLLRAATFGRGAYQVHTDTPVGSLIAYTGRLTFLRAHDVGTAFGRSPNVLDVEVVLQLDTAPGMSFGFQLREDPEEPARREMLDLLRSALTQNRPVSIDVRRTAPRVGVVIRVALRD
jgi:hypothetical protein